MSEANNRQVAGDHYKATYQHWDFVADAGLGYFEGQITKYLSRHHKKNGKQDVEKALHFAEKWRELALAGKVRPSGVPHAKAVPMGIRFIKENNLTGEVANAVQACTVWYTREHLNFVIHAIRHVLDAYPTTVTDPVNVHYVQKEHPETLGGAGPGYVNQDR